MRIPGFSSTGSKRPESLYGAGAPVGLPVRLSRAEGARVWDDEGRQYLDFIMGLGAVALGYGHPDVNRAAHAAIDAGVVGPLPPEQEERLAEKLASIMPWMERTRFLKTGAEAVAAAIRLARAATGRDHVVRCGYHGWLDWSQEQGAPGIPAATFELSTAIPFNNLEVTRDTLNRLGEKIAAVVIEPFIEVEPDPEWLILLREETHRIGAVFMLDEIKTGFRLAPGGAAERYQIDPDLVILGKAMANGFPLAAVGGRRQIMEAARRTWISSTLATEMVSLAAAQATIDVILRDHVPLHLNRVGTGLIEGLRAMADRHPALIAGVVGIPEMCGLKFQLEQAGALVARAAAGRGLLWKRSAYNFVSLAHKEPMIEKALSLLEAACEEVDAGS
ncbi:MAG TPA: aminotransferase class III-fold pyridoxal phosphate-dependent enzyme [Gemmatimonadales bacterium]|nr:aminotransferase class III-fold pyridoxal phosphate-dependent enzyme [Gemmatimonadales bacterium]